MAPGDGGKLRQDDCDETSRRALQPSRKTLCGDVRQNEWGPGRVEVQTAAEVVGVKLCWFEARPVNPRLMEGGCRALEGGSGDLGAEDKHDWRYSHDRSCRVHCSTPAGEGAPHVPWRGSPQVTE